MNLNSTNFNRNLSTSTTTATTSTTPISNSFKFSNNQFNDTQSPPSFTIHSKLYPQLTSIQAQSSTILASKELLESSLSNQTQSAIENQSISTKMDLEDGNARIVNGGGDNVKRSSYGEGSAAIKAREMMIKLGLDVDENEGDLNSSELSESDWSTMSSPVKGLSRSNSGEAMNGIAIERNLSPSSTTRNLSTSNSSPSAYKSSTSSNYPYSAPPSPQPISPITSSPTKSNTFKILNRLSSGTPSQSHSNHPQSSKFSDAHSRNYSLTSACPPVTSSDMSPTNPRQGLNIVSGFFGGSTSPSSPTTATGTGSSSKSWNIPGWNSSGLKVPGSPTLSNAPRKLSKSLSPISSLSISSPNSYVDTILFFPSLILSRILSPLSNHSSSTNKSSKKASLPIRLIIIIYLIFSVLFFGIKVLNWSTGTSTGNTRGVIDKVISRLGSRSDGVLILGAEGGRSVKSENSLVSEWASSSAATSTVEDHLYEKDSEWTTVKRIGEAGEC